MAAPNIANPTTITGKTAVTTPAVTTESVLLSNAAASGKVLKVNFVKAANIDGTAAYAASLAWNSAAAGTGTSTLLADRIDVPAKSTMVLLGKDEPLYLEEDKSLVTKSSTASKFAFSVSYEDIS